jgi:phage terminase large subunit GpA-like protein
MSINNLPASPSRLAPSEKAEALRREIRAALSTPPRLSVPAWADQYRVLARGYGSQSGQWSTDTVEIARGPMLAVTEPGVHRISVMCCTQLLKTELILNIAGFHAHTDPCPILLLQPKDDAAEQFSKERLQPMVAATPALRERVGAGKARSSETTLTYKPYPGGFLALAGAGSPDNLARRPIRVLLADEVDKYPITREGDPIMLAEERTATFGLNWLSVQACSPTIEDESRIAALEAQSDQRRASVACPHCAHRLFPDFFKHVQWEKDDGGQHMPKTARIFCEACGAGWSEGERLKALSTIRWHQTRPFTCCGVRHAPLDAYDQAWRADAEAPVDAVWQWWDDTSEGRYAVYRAVCPTCGKQGVENTHVGFQASKLFSPSPKDRPADIAAKWLAAKGDPDKELVWWNTQMGLPHRPTSGKTLAVDALLARRESWPGSVPEGAGVLTAAMDVQDYRVELETVAWGADEESWSVDHTVIEGEFSDKLVQAAVDAYLLRTWTDARGRGFKAEAACLDSGGHHTQAVYEFAKARLGRHVWAVKGASERDGQRNPIWPTKRPSRKSKAAFRPVIIGGNTARDTIRNRLVLEPPAPGAAKPGYMHFPADRDVGYFDQLIADRKELREAGGRKYTVWVTPAGRANEAADLKVYNLAALCGLKHFGLQVNRRVVLRRAGAVEAPSPPPAPVAHAAPAAPSAGPSMLSAPEQAPAAPAGRRSRVSRLA